MPVRFVKGNEAILQGAILAGCRVFFGYPITPSSEIAESAASLMPKIGGVFLQSESEIGAINMVYGASGAGARVMTTSSSPGISLMQEGLSYIASAELPCLVANINRGGPGLGTIQPSQGDYFQATKGGGHGDYHVIVLAPSSVQEMADFVFDGFDLADTYRNPAMILADGALGQMMEKVEFREYDPAEHVPPKPWATVGKPPTRERNIITSLQLASEDMEKVNLKLQEKYRTIEAREIRCETIMTEDAEVLLVAYGLSARIAQKAMQMARAEGIRAGLLRPITLWPYPYAAVRSLAEQVSGMLVVEMNAGQMVEDVRLGVEGRVPVSFYGRMGGIIPSPEEVLRELKQAIAKQTTKQVEVS